MSATNAFETDFLKHIFQNLAIANVGDASGLQPAATAGSFYVSLHTDDPGETGDQTTNEATYTGYARVAVARSAAGWTISGNEISNAAAVTFGACSAGSNTITHFGIGTAETTAGHLLFSGELTAPLAVSAGITPEFAIGDLDVTAD
jgi:hypothetical protein